MTPKDSQVIHHIPFNPFAAHSAVLWPSIKMAVDQPLVQIFIKLN